MLSATTYPSSAQSYCHCPGSLFYVSLALNSSSRGEFSEFSTVEGRPSPFKDLQWRLSQTHECIVAKKYDSFLHSSTLWISFECMFIYEHWFQASRNNPWQPRHCSLLPKMRNPRTSPLMQAVSSSELLGNTQPSSDSVSHTSMFWNLWTKLKMYYHHTLYKVVEEETNELKYINISLDIVRKRT